MLKMIIFVHCNISPVPQLNLAFKNKAAFVTKWKQVVLWEAELMKTLFQWSYSSLAVTVPCHSPSSFSYLPGCCPPTAAWLGTQRHVLWLVWSLCVSLITWCVLERQRSRVVPACPWMRGIYLRLASLSTFHRAPKNFVVFRLESLNEIEIGITWGEAERQNLGGLHKLCFFWKSRLQHNKICSCFHLC